MIHHQRSSAHTNRCVCVSISRCRSTWSAHTLPCSSEFTHSSSLKTLWCGDNFTPRVRVPTNFLSLESSSCSSTCSLCSLSNLSHWSTNSVSKSSFLHLNSSISLCFSCISCRNLSTFKSLYVILVSLTCKRSRNTSTSVSWIASVFQKGSPPGGPNVSGVDPDWSHPPPLPPPSSSCE